MDEYLQYMKTLRSHMNDAEDQAAKISAEEQMQMTNIHTLESDINSAKSEIARVVEDTEKMNKSKVEICSTIMENQKKLAALESDSSRLTQTMELIRQEKVGLSAKFSERRAYYSTITEDMVAKFDKQKCLRNPNAKPYQQKFYKYPFPPKFPSYKHFKPKKESPIPKKMDEYLQYMKTLRSHMNDAEDQAAKISAEEQMQMTNIHTLESDINSAKSEIARVVEDTEKMNKSKVEICSTIMENQKKLAALESDSSRLTQTMELIQQEKVGLSAKFSERRAYYSTVAEDMVAKFEKQKEWIRTKKTSREPKEHKAGDIVHGQRSESEGRTGADDNRAIDKLGSDAKRKLITDLGSAKVRLDEILVMKSKIPMDIDKVKLAIEDVKCRENEFKPELKAADITAIEEEYNALLSDKAGETEYLQSMEKQVEKLKKICHEIKCACGETYTVALNIQ